VIGIVGCLFLPWYEAEWVFPDDYDMTLFGSQSAMFFGIKVATAIAGALTVLFAVLGRKMEAKQPRSNAD
jgi:hypothetical protein